MPALDFELRSRFIQVLLRIPGMEYFQVRSTLPTRLPIPLLPRRSQAAAFTDLSNIMTGTESHGRLDDRRGTGPLIRVAENALLRVGRSGDLGAVLQEVIRGLAQ